MARTTKLTPAIQRAIIRAVAHGMALEPAAQLVGIDGKTATEWYRRGEGLMPTRPSTPLYAAFAAAVKKARAQDEARRVRRITKAGQGGTVVYEKITTYPDGRELKEVRYADPQWTADAWVLERSRPESWGKKERIDMRVTIQQAAEKIATELGLTVEEVLAEAEGLLKA